MRAGFIKTITTISLGALITPYAIAQLDEDLPPTSKRPSATQLWNLEMIGLPLALEQGFTGEGFTIGIFDGPVEFNHPEFAGRWKAGLGADGGPYGPAEGHGTHVAGTAAGTNVGVARGALIVGIDLETPEPEGYRFGLAQGVRAFNNSWSYEWSPNVDITTDDVDADILKEEFPETLAAFAAVDAAGVIQVFATGNAGFDQPAWTAGFPHFFPEYQPLWLAVTAVGPDRTLAEYANACGVAAEWCLAAPGGALVYDGSNDAVWSAWPGRQYQSIFGTSMATPAVTGTIAITAQIFPAAKGPELTQMVLQTATDLGAPGVDPVFGWGLLNIGNIVNTINPATAGTYANAAWARFDAIGHTTTAIRQGLTLPMADDEAANGFYKMPSGVWITPIYGQSRINDGPRSRSARSETRGALIGVDILENAKSRFGLTGGYTETQLSTRGAADHGKAESFHLGVYGSFDREGWYGEGSAQIAWFDQALTRHEIFGAQGTSRTPIGESNYRGNTIGADARLGYAFSLSGGSTLSPYAALTPTWQKSKSFSEDGAAIFSLDVPSNSLNQFTLSPGLSWLSVPIITERATVHFKTDIAYARMSGDLNHATDVTLLGRTIQGRTAEIGRDVLQMGGQINLTGASERFSGFIAYNGAFQQRAVSHSALAGLRIAF